jgi:signal transduction histidine kinase
MGQKEPGGGSKLPSVVSFNNKLVLTLANFLTNALKYSEEERSVEVGAHEDCQQGRVWVRDRGPGIPQDEQEHIWKRFYQARGVEVQSGSGIGLGLGLHISRTIIEQHGGQVGVQSTPGQGSTFWFTLPLAVPGQGAGAEA